MNSKVNEGMENEIKDLVAKYGNNRTALMPILRELQKHYREVPDYAMQVVADQLGIHAIEVQDTVSFYHFFGTEELGKYTIYMCENMPCKMKEAEKVAKAFETALGIKFGETTKDGMFSLKWTSCIGMCDQAPALLINDQPYTRVKAEEVMSIIEKCKAEGK
jgi:[NiFe] hydrogenase diaphorase moiety large subunit